ncbi:MAG TPA: HAD family acid phosphatase [Elusimicrobiota bacterium]|nr:HAD family acid phosphatase [Elusimicrobiota bacterium]
MKLSRFIVAVFLGMALVPTVRAQMPTPAIPKDIQYAHSIEFAAIQTEVYRLAWPIVRAAAKKQKGKWAVVLDVDQTVLDNAAFQKMLGSRHFSEAIWKEWTARADAAAIPGARAFLDKVRALPRGEIVFITDRGDDEAAATRADLRAQGLFKKGDVLLTKKDKADNKGARRDCVEKALDPRCKAQGPRTIIALFGDSARDFEELYGQDMDARGRQDILRLAGTKYFVLPNPMYGQWENGYK